MRISRHGKTWKWWKTEKARELGQKRPKCNTKPNEKCIKKIKNVFIAEILNAWVYYYLWTFIE